MYALVDFADSTFHESTLCSGCSFNFHFYIHKFICIFFPIVFNFVIRIIDLDQQYWAIFTVYVYTTL